MCGKSLDEVIVTIRSNIRKQKLFDYRLTSESNNIPTVSSNIHMIFNKLNNVLLL